MGVGGQRHSPAALPPGNRPGTHCIGDWVGPRAGLDVCGKYRLHWDSIPGPCNPQRVAMLTTLFRLTNKYVNKEINILPSTKKIVPARPSINLFSPLNTVYVTQVAIFFCVMNTKALHKPCML